MRACIGAIYTYMHHGIAKKVLHAINHPDSLFWCVIYLSIPRHSPKTTHTDLKNHTVPYGRYFKTATVSLFLDNKWEL